MGMLDSITGSLGSLGSITKMFDVGNIVKEVANKVLPQNMHFIGDAAGAYVDFQSGNLIGAAQLGMQAMKDLPQATQGQQQPQGASSKNAADLANSKPALEPSPPPTAKDPKSFDWNDLLSAIKALTAALAGHGTKPTADSTAKGTDTSAKSADTPAKATDATNTKQSGTTTTTTTTTTITTKASASAASTPAGSTPAPATTSRSATEDHGNWRKHGSGWSGGRNTASSTSANQTTESAWRGQPQTAAPAPSSDAASASAKKMSAEAASTASSTLSARSASSASDASHATPAATSSAAPAPSTAAPAPAADHPAAASANTAGASATKPPASAATPASSATGQTVTSVQQLNGMTDAAFLDAVRNGRISSDVAKDPTAMMAVQERMNEVTQMNNLMTGMMRAIHDMQMAVIQNIRI
jgi:hypothetical protein